MDSSNATASVTNPAVQRCIEAGRKAFEINRSKGEPEDEANDAANLAYLDAMPHLEGAQNIRDFIACVAHANLKGFIYEKQASTLLYAAQVALASVVRTVAQKEQPKSAAPAPAKPPASQPPDPSGESKAA